MELAFKEFGQGRPLIILHGLFGSSDNWLTIGKRLAHTFHVFLVDQRNHGDSFHSDAHDYELLAEDLLNFIKHHDIEKPIIIGHSMGGKTAMKFGINHPGLCDKIVIVDIGPKAYNLRHDLIIDALNTLDLHTLHSRNDADKQLEKHISDIHIRQFLLKNLKRTSNGFEWKINLPSLTKNMVKLGVGLQESAPSDLPILFIRGEKSDYILDQDSISIVSLFPNAEIITIQGAGHWVHAEKPEEFILALEKFIR